MPVIEYAETDAWEPPFSAARKVTTMGTGPLEVGLLNVNLYSPDILKSLMPCGWTCLKAGVK